MVEPVAASDDVQNHPKPFHQPPRDGEKPGADEASRPGLGNRHGAAAKMIIRSAAPGVSSSSVSDAENGPGVPAT